MIYEVMNNDCKKLAVSFPLLDSMSGVRDLRNALSEVLDSCLSSDETKNNTPSMALWTVLQLVRELSTDIEEKGLE